MLSHVTDELGRKVNFTGREWYMPSVKMCSDICLKHTEVCEPWERGSVVELCPSSSALPSRYHPPTPTQMMSVTSNSRHEHLQHADIPTQREQTFETRLLITRASLIANFYAH